MIITSLSPSVLYEDIIIKKGKTNTYSHLSLYMFVLSRIQPPLIISFPFIDIPSPSLSS